MQFFPDRTTVIALGSFSIKWYAVIILTGAYITYLISKHNFKQKGYPLALLENIFRMLVKRCFRCQTLVYPV